MKLPILQKCRNTLSTDRSQQLETKRNLFGKNDQSLKFLNKTDANLPPYSGYIFMFLFVIFS